MLLAFEGTGMQPKGQRNDWSDPKNKYSQQSFINRVCKRSKDPNTRYFAGPDMWGTNCHAILKDAIGYFDEQVKRSGRPEKIYLFGYSRGAFIALCFATYLKQFNLKVDFLGMFDAVSMDNSIPGDGWFEYEKLATRVVPNNVKVCYHAARDPRIGSRSWTMDHCGNLFEGASSYPYITVPGSHAAMGGFPNDAGFGDGPKDGQGDPQNPGRFHPWKEITAWWLAADHISQAAMRHQAISTHILNDKLPKPDLMPSNQWYEKQFPRTAVWNRF